MGCRKKHEQTHQYTQSVAPVATGSRASRCGARGSGLDVTVVAVTDAEGDHVHQRAGHERLKVGERLRLHELDDWVTQQVARAGGEHDERVG